MKKIDIVRASKDHINDIVIIENLSFKIPWSRKSVADEILRNESAIYFSALTDGMTVGYAGMWQVCDEGHITNIAVHPEYRGAGIGGALIEALLKEAKERGIIALTLEVRTSNLNAQALYHKYGFEDGGMRKAYYSDNREDAIIMWKQLG